MTISIHENCFIHTVPDTRFSFEGGGGLKNVFPWDIFYNIAASD
jgi:hypothetical protein